MVERWYLNLKPELKHKIRVIPHGNNMKNYFPIESKEEVSTLEKPFLVIMQINS
jgi:hypothetical protein